MQYGEVLSFTVKAASLFKNNKDEIVRNSVAMIC